MQEALDVLELDRVLDSAPDEIEGHRRGLEEARRRRLADLGAATDRLLARIVAAAETANDKVLLHPRRSPRAVQASETVTRSLADFHELIGRVSETPHLEARRWSSAVAQVRDRAVDVGAGRVSAVRSGGGKALGRVRQGVADTKAAAEQIPGRVRGARPKPGEDSP